MHRLKISLSINLNSSTFKVSEMFGGLDICSLEAVVAKDDSEHIIEVNDCAMKLMGDSADEDRELIAQLVLQKMEVNTLAKNTIPHQHTFSFLDILKEHCSVDTRVENDVMKSEMKDMDGLGEGKQRNICRTDSRGKYIHQPGLNLNQCLFTMQNPQVSID